MAAQDVPRPIFVTTRQNLFFVDSPRLLNFHPAASQPQPGGMGIPGPGKSQKVTVSVPKKILGHIACRCYIIDIDTGKQRIVHGVSHGHKRNTQINKRSGKLLGRKGRGQNQAIAPPIGKRGRIQIFRTEFAPVIEQNGAPLIKGRADRALKDRAIVGMCQVDISARPRTIPMVLVRPCASACATA